MKYAPSESLVQQAIMDWLTATRIFHKRMPLGGVMAKGGAFMMKNPMKGFPDLWGFLPGTRRGEMFVIEVKKQKTGRLSPEQKEWRATLERFGVFYIEARTIDDVREAFARRFG